MFVNKWKLSGKRAEVEADLCALRLLEAVVLINQLVGVKCLDYMCK